MQQERLRALGQMASGIAHDINNAITPISFYTEVLLEQEADLSQRGREQLETIGRAASDVSQTVARMREFYRHRGPELSLASLNLNTLAQQVADLTRARWSDMPQQRGVVINLEMALHPSLPEFMGVESEIREALINLIFNGVDAMPHGGTLTLLTRVSEAPAAAGARVMRSVEVEVKDTGVGMEEETRKRCFEPFFTTKGERGTGLGLAMVYGIVKRHGADIEIDSEMGRGTTVRMRFGISDQSTGPGKAGQGLTPSARLRILVVDDDPVIVNVMRDVLESDGHVVVAAGGGQAGIDAFEAARKRDEPFAVVITDLGMPYVDGRKVASAVKGASPKTPVVMLTGWGQRLVAEGDTPSHVDRVLNKPPKLHELRQTLAEVMG
jgi:CheY-like chemotaxis protein